jgi:hypothetical protein
MTDTKFPLQPIKDGRFVQNRIVRDLLDKGPLDLNIIAVGDYTQQERIQFAQLIGYSLSGFSSLSYVDNETYQAAELLSDGLVASEARYTALSVQMENIKENVRNAAVELFNVHPDDLV